jgi:hypothetical protein
MSWWTFLEFDYLGDTPEFDIEDARAKIESIVAISRYHPVVATSLCTLLATKKADLKIISYAAIELFSNLAAEFPDISFAVRGRGEDIRDIWLREYAGGKTTFALGPPEGASL